MSDEFDDNDVVYYEDTGVVCPICGGKTDWIDNSYGGLSPACRNRKCRIYAQPMLSDASPKDTTAALQAQVDRLKEIIRKAEWLWYRQDYPVPDPFQACQICHNDYLLGHATDCPFYKWEGGE